MGICAAVFFIAQAGLAGTEEIDFGADRVEIDSQLRFSLEYAAIPCEIVTQRPLTISEIEATHVGGNDDACNDAATQPQLFTGKVVLLSVVSSMFLHGGVAHLGFNLLFLWIFGNNIEDRLGHAMFLAFYLTGGIAATMGHILAQPTSTIAVVGASGAIAAVMGAYLVWFPDAPIRTLVFLVLVDIRARWFLIAWFIIQFFTSPDAGVAWVAHVAGFAYGVLMGIVIRRRSWDPTGGVGRGPYPHPGDYVPHHLPDPRPVGEVRQGPPR